MWKNKINVCEARVTTNATEDTFKNVLVPKSVRSKVALTPTGCFQFDKSPTRRIKSAHEGDANAQYHKPVACNDS